MVAHNLRFADPDDLPGIWEVFRMAFGFQHRDRDRWMAAVRPERCVVADGPRGTIAAASHVRAFGQWFGGRPVALGGYSPVAVAPEHRGRGLGQAVIVGHYDDLRQRGEMTAGLFPAAVALYRKVGFEVAGSYVQRQLPAALFGNLPPAPDVIVRRGEPDDRAAIIRCYERLARCTDGALLRDEHLWRARLPDDLAGVEVFVVDADDRSGEVDSYAIYRMTPGRPSVDYAVTVSEVVAGHADQHRALWRVVGSSSSQAPDVHVAGPAEDPLFLVLGSADVTAVQREIRWMLRLIDVAGAVGTRGWNPTVSGRVHLQVRDRHASWNDGRWVLEVDGGEGRLTPGGDGTVEVGIGGLSTWWSGYASARTLARSGHLGSADQRALSVLDGLGASSPPVLDDVY